MQISTHFKMARVAFCHTPVVGHRVEHVTFEMWVLAALVHRSMNERIPVFDAVSMRYLSCTGRISGARMPAFD